MSARLTTALLKRANRTSAQCRDVAGLITDAFRERYGVTHSDIDADELIEALDYGAGEAPTLAEVDKIMTEAGHPPLSGRP